MPIIKSTARKDEYALAQLIRYVFQEESKQLKSFTLLHNIIADPSDVEAIIEQFKENDTWRKKRKNGRILHHTIISFSPDDSKILRATPSIIEDIARHYMLKRAPYGMALGKLHEDKAHVHVHLIFSATEKGSSKSIRMTKAAFKQLRRDMERYQLEKYPELEHSYIHESVREKKKQQERGQDISPEREI